MVVIKSITAAKIINQGDSIQYIEMNNIYVYGPKDDPYHREKWREPYPESQRKKLAKLIRAAQRAGASALTLLP